MPQSASAQSLPLTRDALSSLVMPHGDNLAARHGELLLRSHFQPIYSLAHQRAVGYEALVRPATADGTPVSPLTLFAGNQTVEQQVFTDRLCRLLHVANFIQQSADNCWLFLNLNPLVTIYGRQHSPFFRDLLEYYNVPPHRIVVEILEGQIGDEDLLAESVNYYRNMGCLIAIDDFGVGHSNFNRIWRIAPHIVKLDKTLIDQAVTNRSVRRVLPGLVSLVHQAGGLALLEGIETEQQALIALQSDIDFVQGYFFARPQQNLQAQAFHPGINALFKTLQEGNERDELTSQYRIKPYRDMFFEGVMNLLDGLPLGEALSLFLELPGVMRCYFLDEHGMQAGDNIVPADFALSANVQFSPLADTSQAIWARRHYFQRAMAEPGLIQTSRPYLSLTGGNLCVTLSAAIHTHDGLRVLCGDVLWEDQ